MRCAVLDDYQDAAFRFADWSQLEGQVTIRRFDRPFRDAAEAVAVLQEFEIVVAMRERTPFPADLLRQLPALRLLVTTGMRNAAIDLAAAAERGIVVCGTDGSPTSTPEMTFALLLGAARHLVRENASLRGGGWQETVGTGLHGKTLGIVGLGNVGRQVAAIAAAFGMKRLAWSANLTDAIATEASTTKATSLAELLDKADFVTLHLKLGDRSRGLIGASELARMKRSAVLVNTARGPIVDEVAVVTALTEQRIAYYAVDVYDREPLPADHPFRSLPNVLATPHLGYVTDDSYRQFYGGAVANILAYLTGSPIRMLT